MVSSRHRIFTPKVVLLVVVLFMACFAVFSLFMNRIDSKIEAMELVKTRHLTQARIESFISDTHREGKFKLLGWDIKTAGEKEVFIVSYSLRRLNDDGFVVGPEEGFWYKVDLSTASCEQIFPPGTASPEIADCKGLPKTADETP